MTLMSAEIARKKKTGHTNNLWNVITRIFNFVPTSVARFDVYSHILAAIEMKCPINWAIVLFCALFYCALFY